MRPQSSAFSSFALRTPMPSIGSKVMENIIVGVVSLCILVYLFWTLIRPESL